jgi:ABC-type transport system involved in multi-copper enzyme maturation permease subunit
MIAQTKAELLKIRSTRATLGLVAGMLALLLLLVLLSGLLSKTGALAGKDAQRNLLGLGSVAALFAALAGLLVVTGEYRHGTIRPTFLFTPRRPRVLVAKLAASMITGLAFGVVAEAIGFAVGAVILASRGVPFALNGGEVTQLVVGTIVGVVLWGGLGVGLGAILRNQVAAVIALLAWGFVIENLVFGLAPSVGRYGPEQAATAITGLTTRHLLSPVAGGAVLIAWVAALVAAGVVLTVRRDVD